MRTSLALLGLIAALALTGPVLADTIDFSQFGADGVTIASPATGMTSGGVSFTIASPNGSFTEYTEGASFLGEFTAGDHILFDQNGPGPVTINFGTAITSILHLGAQANAYGAFTETLTAYNGTTLLGSTSADSFNFDDPAFEGTLPGLNYSAAAITSISIGTTNDGVGFALGTATAAGGTGGGGGTGGTGGGTGGGGTVPEPASWAMLVSGFGLLGAMLRLPRPRLRYA